MCMKMMVLPIFIIVTIGTVSGADTVWTTGYDVVLQQDELTTSGNFTIKVIDFPAPVTGHKTVNSTIEPDYSVSPFVGLELYYDIINNPSPITTFILTQGESYSFRKEIKITLKSIPGPLSTVWIYQFYKPKVTLAIQTRSKPNLDISIGLDKKDIYVGDQLRISLNIKNAGDSVIENLDASMNSAPELAIQEKLSIGNLNKGEDYAKQFVISAPDSIDTKDYFINVSVTGRDIKGLLYIWNKSSTFSVKNRDIKYRDVKIYKNVRTTFYLKDSISVILSIYNPGPYKIEKIRIDDSIPDKLIILENRSLLYNRTIHWDILKVDPSNSITIGYNLKASEPGPHVLPKMTMNYTINGVTYTAISEEIGFRIFGPKVVLKKYIEDNGSGILNIKISARNVGNTFTKVDISDKLPSNMTYKIVSGGLNSTTGLYPDDEKTVTYSIKTNAMNINTTEWPPVNATYYLDKFKFETSSDEKELDISKSIPILDISTPNPTPVSQNISVELTPNVTTSSPKVVATLTKKIPIQMPEKKSIPGFRLYDMLSSISLIATLSILGKLRKMFD